MNSIDSIIEVFEKYGITIDNVGYRIFTINVTVVILFLIITDYGSYNLYIFDTSNNKQKLNIKNSEDMEMFYHYIDLKKRNLKIEEFLNNDI